jgi:transcription initiation factor TFIIIB Brf1 subunit/transcription initiation factor TFIIB
MKDIEGMFNVDEPGVSTLKKTSTHFYTSSPLPIFVHEDLPSSGYGLKKWYNGEETKLLNCIDKLMKMVDIFHFTFQTMKRACYIIHKLLKSAPVHESNTIVAISLYVTMRETKMKTSFQEMMKTTEENGISVKRYEFKKLLSESRKLVNVSYDKKAGIDKIVDYLSNSLDFHVKMNMLTSGMLNIPTIIEKSAKLAKLLKKNDKKVRKRPYTYAQAFVDAFFKTVEKNNIALDITKQQLSRFIRTGRWD